MTDPATGDPDVGGGTSSGPRVGLGALATLLAVGLALRLIIVSAMPGAGFGVDLDAFRYWANDLATNGPFGFYDRGFFADYTPGYLYLLWFVGEVGGLIGGIGDLIKLPSIVADLAIAWLVHAMALELGAPKRRALAAAAAVLLLPVSWFDSVVWGQVDAVGVVLLLLGVRAIWRERSVEAAIWATLAAVVKPQLGILVFILAAWVVGRLVRDRVRESGAIARALALPSIAAAATASLLSAPFGLTLPGLFAKVTSTAAGYPFVSVNAYNPWALVSVDGHGIIADGTWVRDLPGELGESALTFGPIPALLVGTLLLLGAIGAIGWVVARRPDRRTVLLGLAVLALAFFVLPTRVHERYLYPFLPLGAILAATSRRWTIPWLIAIGGTFLNMYVVLTTLYPGNPGIADWLGIGPFVRSPLGVTIVALAQVGVLVWGARRLRDRARGVEDPAPAIAHSSAPLPGSLPPFPAPAGVTDPLGQLGAFMARTGAVRGLLDRPDPTDPGPLAIVRRRLLARPLRADRSGLLRGEGGARLDRLDLWLLVVVMVTLGSVRMARLELPYQMHFDEVYHARTATEFLQDWRYDQVHSIYEFTHPHLAKYAMAGGLVLFGNDRVTATSSLGAPVRAAALERRWDDPRLPAARAGDRLYVATGNELRAYDLAHRDLVVAIQVPGASSVAVSAERREVYVGTGDGTISALSTTLLDDLRAGGSAPGAADLRPVSDGVGAILRLAAPDGADLLAILDDGSLIAIDPDTGEVRARTPLPGASEAVAAGSAETLVALPGEIADPADVADRLARILGGSVASWRAKLDPGEGTRVLAPAPTGEPRTTLDAAIADGSLAGLEVRTLARVAVGTSDGIAIVAPATGDVVQRLVTSAPVTGLAGTTGLDTTYVYAAAGEQVAVVALPKGDEAGDARISNTIEMPGSVRAVVWDPSTLMVHVLGRTPEASAATTAAGAGTTEPTIYVIEPHANAVYADAVLPQEPVALVADVAPGYPTSERQELLALAADGSAAAVDAGSHAFAWRLPGVIAGLLMTLCLYLLARFLFARRSVAVLVALFSGLDGMAFVQSRIGMNDAYVGLFIVAAYLVFAGLWTGRWRSPLAFALGMPLVGILLGLALASKWVGLYALGGLLVLVLARSALGRLLLVGGLVAVTALLGYQALAVAPEATNGGNLTFVLVMVGLTLATVAISVLRPIAWTVEEVRFAVGAPLLGGIAILALALPLGLLPSAATPCDPAAGPCLDRLVLEAAFGLVALGAAAALAFVLLGRAGHGPLARGGQATAARPSPAPGGWLRAGSFAGLPAVWLVVSLVVLPLAVYVASYLPWVALGNRITESWPPGNTGQTLAALTQSMYGYHNDLRAAHAASSPWWAWPFDLKPVWFYQGNFEGGTAGAIYDAGNLVIWWLGIPAMAWSAWTAWRRRHLGLALIAIGFLCQWIPWARIDRATFQYHYYTSLPFLLLALAAFVAELWHGASRGTWLLARVAAALAAMGPLLLWLLRLPLCSLARVEIANPGSQACTLMTPGQVVLTARTAGLVLVLVATAILLVRAALRGSRTGGGAGSLILAAAGGALALALAGRLLDETVLFTIDAFPPEPLALAILVPVGFLAWIVATARDAHRFVGGIVVAALGWFVLWYPNLTGLGLPSDFHNAYQGLLPTYLYPFQFAVNLDPPAALPPLVSLEFALLVGALLLATVSTAFAAAAWRDPVPAPEAEPRATEPERLEAEP